MKRLIASLFIYTLLCGALVIGVCNRVMAQSTFVGDEQGTLSKLYGGAHVSQPEVPDCGIRVIACNRVMAQTENKLVTIFVDKDIALQVFSKLDQGEYVNAEQAQSLLTEKRDGRRVALVVDDYAILSARGWGIAPTYGSYFGPYKFNPSQALQAALEHALGTAAPLRICTADDLRYRDLSRFLRPGHSGYCKEQLR